MNVLVYGAGVIGTIYAAKLRQHGHSVTVLARGERLADIRLYGLVLEDIVGGQRTATHVETTERLGFDDRYDVVIVMVRRDQIADVLPELSANRHTPTILFMLNNPNGTANLVDILGQERVVLGFPGASGMRKGHVIHYALIAQQPTTLGEIGGQKTERLRKLEETFRTSGFPTKISFDMDAWLKTHAFFVTAICGATYMSGGNCVQLSKDDLVLRLMTSGVHEGFAVLRTLGISVTPFPLKVLFTWLPQTFAIYYWRHFFALPMADYVFGRHARNAPKEMQQVANDCRIMVKESSVEAPALGQLYRAIDTYAAQTT